MSAQGWPAWATERVVVVPYDDAWPRRARSLGREVAEALGDGLCTEVHHIGSTAVPGLSAKPIIDLMAAVPSLDVVDRCAGLLGPTGWHLVPPDLDDRPWRRLLVKVAEDARAAHLHLLRPEDPRWAQQLQLVAHLREHPATAAAYGALKERLATVHTDDREAYTAAKAPFIRDLLTQAGGPTPDMSDG